MVNMRRKAALEAQAKKKKPSPAAAEKGAPGFIENQEAAPATVEMIREQLRLVRDAEARVRDLQSVVSEENLNINRMRFEVLPDLFASAGIDQLGLPAEGNHQAFDCKLDKFYRANIAADWDEERRRAAFAELEKRGHADLIKTELHIYVAREDRKKVKDILAALKKFKVNIEVSENVHSSTLTAFIREQVGEKKAILPLDKLGATVGMVVKMKERKVK